MPVVTTQLDREKTARLTVYGNLTIRTAGQLVDAFDKLRNQDVTSFVIDLGKVTYLDSTGVACLIRVSQALDALDGDLRIVGVTAGAAEIFRTTRLDTVLPLEAAETPDDAG